MVPSASVKLSVDRVFGMRQVRGAQLLRVLHPHQVDAKGAAIGEAQASPATSFRAVQGDLAVELVDVQTGHLVGYSYLTGQALQAVSYECAGHRYEPAVLERGTAIERAMEAIIAAYTRGVSPADPQVPTLLGDLVAAVLAAKHGPGDVVYVDVVVGRHAQGAGEAIVDAWANYHPDDPTGMPAPEARTVNLIATLREKPRRPASILRRGGRVVMLHLQPPRHATKLAATPFQGAVLRGMLEREPAAAAC